MLHRREGCGERARPAETIVNPISVNGRRGLIAVGPTRDLRSLIGLVVDQYPFDPNEELAGDIGAAFAGSVGTAISVANARAAIRAFMIRLHVLDHRSICASARRPIGRRLQSSVAFSRSGKTMFIPRLARIRAVSAEPHDSSDRSEPMSCTLSVDISSTNGAAVDSHIMVIEDAPHKS